MGNVHFYVSMLRLLGDLCRHAFNQAHTGCLNLKIVQEVVDRSLSLKIYLRVTYKLYMFRHHSISFTSMQSSLAPPGRNRRTRWKTLTRSCSFWSSDVRGFRGDHSYPPRLRGRRQFERFVCGSRRWTWPPSRPWRPNPLEKHVHEMPFCHCHKSDEWWRDVSECELVLT